MASVNLVIRTEALPAAKWLKENFGTEYIYPAQCSKSPPSCKNTGVSIAGDYDLVTGIHEFMKSVGLKVEHLICNHSLGRIKPQTDDILFYQTERERIAVLQELHHQWVLADDISLGICPEDNEKLCISAPAINQVEREEDSQLMGTGRVPYTAGTVRFQSLSGTASAPCHRPGDTCRPQDSDFR